MNIKKMKMMSRDGVDKNIELIGNLFPHVISERKDEEGNIEYGIDFELLKQELSRSIIESNEERYQFIWPDKKKSILLANSPIAATLRPCKDESVNFDATENLYIEGDNLDVLKLLQETYLGKVKMIYIDPPYNTGNDFVYEDDFASDAKEYLSRDGQYDEQGNRMVQNMDSNGRFHTDWLNMIYPRLKVAKDLLSDDGVIFISIDDNEVENLKKICNEIFGEKNFIAELIWRKKSGGANDSIDIAREHEYIFCFKKNSNGILKIPLSDDRIKEYKFRDEKFKTHGGYTIKDLCDKSLHDSQGLHYDIKAPDGKFISGLKNQWKCNQDTFIKRLLENRIEFKKNKSGEWKVYYKLYLNEEKGKLRIDDKGSVIARGRNLSSIIDNTLNRDGNEDMKKLSIEKIFSYPKPMKLILQLLQASTYKDSLILDFFSGSGTTAHAVMKLNAEDGGNRKFICVQLPETTDEKSEAYKAGYKNICEIGKERIRRAGKKIIDEAGLAGQKLDIGFRVLKLDSTNMKDVYYNPIQLGQGDLDSLVSNIKDDRTAEDLLFQVMLELGILLSSRIESTMLAGKKVFNVADNFLIACFDELVTDDVVKTIAQQKPVYAIFRDSSMADDNVTTNFDQIFATYSPDTVRRIL